MATLTTSYQKIAQGTAKTFGATTSRVDIYAKYNSQSTANNTTNYSVQLRLVKVSGGYIGEYSGTTVKVSSTGLTSYSASGGTGDFTSKTLATITGNVSHNSDGTKSVSMSGSMYFKAWGQTISVSGSATLPSIPRYASINSFTVNKRDETSFTFNWSADATIDYVWYSTNNGSSWTGYDVTDGTSGSFTVSGLSANSTYNCKIRVRRKDSQLTTDSSTVSQSTYDWPYCTSSPNFTIGNVLRLDFYNPLGRQITVTGIGNNNTSIFAGTTNGTYLIGFNDTNSVNTQYSSIPNQTNATYQVRVVYGSSTKTRNNGNTYSINTSACLPTFTDFDYEDRDNTILPITGDNQILVNGNSDCFFIIPTSKKAVAKNSATITKYVGTWGSVTNEVAEASGTVEKNLYDGNGSTLKVTAYDSRGLSTTVTKTITNVAYTNANITNLTTQREDGVDTKTFLIGNFNIAKVNWEAGSDTNYDNRLKYVGYSVYDNANDTWSNYYDITSSVLAVAHTSEDNNVITYSIGVDDEVQIHENGSSGGFTIGTQYKIKVLIKDGTSTTVFTPYSYQATAEATVTDGKIAYAIHKDNNGEYHFGINEMSNDNYTTEVNGDTNIKGNLYLNGSSIIESGSNTNGNWIKYADGTMICYNTIQFTNVSINNAWGALYESTAIDLGSFPTAFIDIPTVTTSVNKGTTVWVEALPNLSATALGNTWFMRPISSTGSNFWISYIAIGKWK